MSAILKCEMAAILNSVEAVPEVQVMSSMWGENDAFVPTVQLNQDCTVWKWYSHTA